MRSIVPLPRFDIYTKKTRKHRCLQAFPLTPRVGLEPTTPRLTAVCSTIELSRIILYIFYPNFLSYIHIKPLQINPQGFSIHLQNSIREEETTLFPSVPNTITGHALDRLVAVSSMRCRTSTPALSTSSSSRGLTTCVGISHLEGGFTLRCLQRLSRPGLATLPWPWRANRCTSGRSIPVLSY